LNDILAEVAVDLVFYRRCAMKFPRVIDHGLALFTGCVVPSVAQAHGQSFLALGLGFYIALAEIIGFSLLLAAMAGSVSRFLKATVFFIGCTILAFIVISLLGLPFSSDVLWDAAALVLSPFFGLLAATVKFGIGSKFWKRAAAAFPTDSREQRE
jgi:hypothetical protein